MEVYLIHGILLFLPGWLWKLIEFLIKLHETICAGAGLYVMWGHVVFVVGRFRGVVAVLLGVVCGGYLLKTHIQQLLLPFVITARCDSRCEGQSHVAPMLAASSEAVNQQCSLRPTIRSGHFVPKDFGRFDF